MPGVDPLVVKKYSIKNGDPLRLIAPSGEIILTNISSINIPRHGNGLVLAVPLIKDQIPVGTKIYLV